MAPRPLRTCVACRTRRPKEALLRIARRDGGVATDPSGRQPGRGAYVCRTGACAEEALRTGAVGRALRVTLPAQDLATLRGEIEEAVMG